MISRKRDMNWIPTTKLSNLIERSMDQFHRFLSSLPFVTASTGLLEWRDHLNWKIPVRCLSVEFLKWVGTVFVFMKVLCVMIKASRVVISRHTSNSFSTSTKSLTVVWSVFFCVSHTHTHTSTSKNKSSQAIWQRQRQNRDRERHRQRQTLIEYGSSNLCRAQGFLTSWLSSVLTGLARSSGGNCTDTGFQAARFLSTHLSWPYLQRSHLQCGHPDDHQPQMKYLRASTPYACPS